MAKKERLNPYESDWKNDIWEENLKNLGFQKGIKNFCVPYGTEDTYKEEADQDGCK